MYGPGRWHHLLHCTLVTLVLGNMLSAVRQLKNAVRLLCVSHGHVTLHACRVTFTFIVPVYSVSLAVTCRYKHALHLQRSRLLSLLTASHVMKSRSIDILSLGIVKAPIE